MGRAKRGCGRVGDKFWTEEKSSFGFKYLSKLGWKPGEGMGATKQGRNKYVHVSVRRENQGLGKKEYTSNEHFKATINMYNDLLTSIQKRCNRGDDDSSSEEEDKHAGRFMSAREMIQRDQAKSFYKRFHLARNQGSTMKADLERSKSRASAQKVNGFTEDDQTNIALKLKALSSKTPGKKGLGFGSANLVKTNLVKNSYVKEYVKAKGIRITAGDSKTTTKNTGAAKKKKKSKKRDSKRKKEKKRRRSSDRKRRKAERKRKEKKKRRKKVDSMTSESKLEAEAMRIAEQLLKCKKTEKRQSNLKSERKKRKAERKLERENKKERKKESSQSSDEILLRQPVLN